MGAAPLDGHPVFAADILQGFHLLEADAGTGKTWTISGLVARALIERDLTIDQILVVTFTRAATAELSRRIRERIEQVATLIQDRLDGRASGVGDAFCVALVDALADPKPALDRLRVALAQIDEAQVRTIHGFCHRVISEHALTIGVARDLRAQALGGAWVARGIAAWWRERISDAPEHVPALLADLGITPDSLAEPVRRIDARPAARIVPGPSDWCEHARRLAELRARLARALDDESDALREWISVKGRVDGKVFQAKRLEGWLGWLRAWCEGSAPATIAIDKAATRLTSEKFAGGAKYEVPPLDIVAICDALAAMQPALLAAPAQVALDAARHVGESRFALKSDAAAIDHDDLLRIVERALADEAGGESLAASLRERYPLALIDECQDTDALQWRIFRAIYRPHDRTQRTGLILVGDPKQAIYAFRAADVYSYLDARSAGPVTHALHENQRSVRPLIDAVNTLFGRDDPFLVPDIGFDASREGAKPRKPFGEARTAPSRAPLTVVALGGAGGSSMLRKADASHIATASCVAEIERLLAPGCATYDDRPLAPGDIAVLVNSHAEGSRIRHALAAAGIGAAEISRDSVLASRECDELIRVVAAIADPSDSQLLKSALATALLDASAEALGERDASDAAMRLASARDRWASSGPQAALRQLFTAAGAWARLARIRDGERRLTNLAHLFELLGSASQPREGARPALRWLTQMREDPGALGEDVGELRLESDDDLVRIVTVHKSKGLEYPIVFIPFAWSGRAFRGRKASGGRTREQASMMPLAYHVHDGGWEAVLDFESAEDSDAWRQAARETHAEALRVLYVAMTRAEQRCYLFWGAAAGAQFAPLAWLLHDLDPAAQKEWRSDSKDPPVLVDAEVDRGLAQWARSANARSPDSATVIAHDALLERHAQRPPQDHAPHRPQLAARPFDAEIPAPWVQTSFTALAARLAHGHAPAAVGTVRDERPDHDQALPAVAEAAQSDDSPAPQAGETSPDAAVPEERVAPIRFAFPAGAQAGTCLHGILEESDFARRVDPALVGRWLARAGFDRVDADAVAGWLDEVLDTPLPDLGGGAPDLRAIAPAGIVREMEFQLHGRGVDERAVLAAIAAEHPIDQRGASARWSGYLRGFIDLLFEHRGRYYLLDWKSNRLGERFDEYGQAATGAAISANAYALQYCVYALALHRMLRTRLPGYEHAKHFGGVYYLFLRGVHPRRADAQGAPLGVHAARPSAKLLGRLDALFGGES